MANRAAMELYLDLGWEAQEVVREWLATGHELVDALLQSNAMGTGDLITPRQARANESRTRNRRQTAEHEAAHATAALALGLQVRYAKIIDEGEGECSYIPGTQMENAISLIAPECWITQLRRDAFPYGATGLKCDHRKLADVSLGDRVLLREAWGHTMEILRQNSAWLLATADSLEKYGYVSF